MHNYCPRCSMVAAAAMSWRCCVFCCESESTLFGLSNEYTTRNQWLIYIYNTVPEQYNTNIRVCAAHLQRTVFWTWERVAFNVNTIKWGNSNDARTVWCFWLIACKYVFIFKESVTDYSNVSFEQCRVVLVWRFYNHKCRHGVTLHRATHKKTVQVIIISNYVLIDCNKCLVYNWFYCFSLFLGTWHHNMVRGVTFPSRIRPIITHWIAGKSEHTSFLRTMSFVKK